MFPEEIKKIRKQYDLNQEEFAKLLNINTKDVIRYANGPLQSQKVNDLLLKIMRTCDIWKVNRIMILLYVLIEMLN